MRYRKQYGRIIKYALGTVAVFCVFRCMSSIFSSCNTGPGMKRQDHDSAPAILYKSLQANNTGNGIETAARQLCFFYNGRLGNWLFQYAAVLGIAREKGMVPTIQRGHPLADKFKLGVDVIDGDVCSTYHVHVGKRFGAFDQESVDFDNRYNTMLSGSFQSWRYFRHAEQELRQHFAFKYEKLEEAKSALLRGLLNQGYDMPPGKTLIGVHVRRGDMLNEEYVRMGYMVAPKDYFLRAMDFFRRKFPSVIFVICSEDAHWSRSFLPHDNSVFMDVRTAEVDLAILSLCDHVIMSVGSYGWWAGWLAGGITVYYKHQVVEGSLLHQGYVQDDYMPPEWIGLE